MRTRPVTLTAMCLCWLAFSPVLTPLCADVVVAYEIVSRDNPTDVDILARLLRADGTFGWDESIPLIVAASTHIETSPVVVTDGAGGAYVIYEVEFAEGEHKGDRDIVAQHISADGKLLWNNGEQPVEVATSKASERHAAAIPDGAGGFIVAYEWADDEEDTDILAQRVSPEGRLLWMHNGLPALVATSPQPERNPVIVGDQQGGAIFLFEWEAPDETTDVMAQRVTGEGRVAWNSGERAIDVAATPNSERSITATSDGSGGALVAFEVEFREGRHKGDVDIMGQRVSPDGVVMWEGGDQPIVIANSNGIERRPKAVSDGAGGMIVAFEYEPLEGEFVGDVDIFAQRVNPEGKLLWHEGEQSALVSTSEGLERSISLISLPDGGSLVVLEHEFRKGQAAGDIDIIGQKLNKDGEMGWNEGTQSSSLSAAKWLERFPLALPDEQGGVIVICTAIAPEGEYEGDIDIWATRADTDGRLLWKEGRGPVEIAASSYLERNPSAAVVR